MIVDNFSIGERDGAVRLSCNVTDSSGTRELEFTRTGFPFIEADTASVNWAAVALLQPAMLAQEDLEIRGTLSNKLFFYLNDTLQECLRIANPQLGKIKVSCDQLSNEPRQPTNRTASGFSAGIDSFATFALHAPGSDEPLRLTDLATFDVGAMGHYGEDSVDDLFRQYDERTRNFAAQKGIDAFSVTSNLSTFYDGISFVRSFTLRNTAAALTAEAHLDNYLCSSGQPLNEVYIQEMDGLAHMDLVTLPMLSTENLNFVSSGAAFSRFEKTRLIASMKDAQEMLDVCQSPAHERVRQEKSNCSRCDKCLRALASLDLIGALEDFNEVFDIEYYKKHRAYLNYRVRQKAKKTDLDMEVVEHAAKMGRPLARAPYLPLLYYASRAREKLFAQRS